MPGFLAHNILSPDFISFVRATRADDGAKPPFDPKTAIQPRKHTEIHGRITTYMVTRPVGSVLRSLDGLIFPCLSVWFRGQPRYSGLTLE